MYITNELQETIATISAKTSFVDISECLAKLSEETGEYSAEYLAVINSLNVSKSAVGTPEAFLEEAIDILIVAHDLVNKTLRTTGKFSEHASEIMERKLNKWESKL